MTTTRNTNSTDRDALDAAVERMERLGLKHAGYRPAGSSHPLDTVDMPLATLTRLLDAYEAQR
jgi:hypothetical protein